jgi:hypothetical protein
LGDCWRSTITEELLAKAFVKGSGGVYKGQETGLGTVLVSYKVELIGFIWEGKYVP